MIAVTTCFRLKHWRHIPIFTFETLKSARQARKSNGLIMMKIRPFSLRTLTVWRSRKDMIAYRNSGAHAKVMRQSHIFGVNKSVSWETSSLPNWPEALSKLANEANPVSCPST